MILSIDVGIRNLAMCLFDETSSRVVQWDVSGIPPEHTDGLFVSLRKHLDDRPWVLSAQTVLIEKQPDRNKKMKTVENFLHAYCVIRAPEAETIVYDARFKIPDVAGPGKAQYAKRKKASVDRCRAFLEADDVNSDWLPVFDASKKKDDLADTVMQALSYVRRVDEAPAKRPSVAPKKLVARKPNENQTRTRYSKSNLAWLYTHQLGCENNKRFMKDLRRYYRDLDDFIKDTTRE